jgi:hypothetical protein
LNDLSISCQNYHQNVKKRKNNCPSRIPTIWTFTYISQGSGWSLMRGFQPLLHGCLLEFQGASTQLAICSKSPCSIAISCRPYLQDAIYSSPPLELSRKVVRTRSEHISQSAHTLHYVRTHPGTIAERNLISAKLARFCGDSRLHWVQTEKAEIPSW